MKDGLRLALALVVGAIFVYLSYHVPSVAYHDSRHVKLRQALTHVRRYDEGF